MSNVKSVVSLIIEEVPMFNNMERKELDQARKDLTRALNALGYITDKHYTDLEFELLTLNMLARCELRGKIVSKYKELK